MKTSMWFMVIALVVAVMPVAVSAQGPPGPGQECNWCNGTGCSHQGCYYECSEELGGTVCGPQHGPQAWSCEACINPEEDEEDEDAQLVVELRPDGTVYAPGTLLNGISSDWLALVGSEIAPGVLATYSSCTQDQLFIWQDARVVTDLRTRTALLEL